MYGWSQFDPARNIDFHGFFWQRPGGNVDAVLPGDD